MPSENGSSFEGLAAPTSNLPLVGRFGEVLPRRRAGGALSAAKAVARLRPCGRHATHRNDRAARGPTHCFSVQSRPSGVIALFFAVSWCTGTSGASPSSTPVGKADATLTPAVPVKFPTPPPPRRLSWRLAVHRRPRRRRRLSHEAMVVDCGIL